MLEKNTKYSSSLKCYRQLYININGNSYLSIYICLSLSKNASNRNRMFKTFSFFFIRKVKNTI